MTRRNGFLIVLALLEWFGFIAQFIFFVDDNPMLIGPLLLRFFSFFTITTNLLVGIYVLAILLKPHHRFFSRPSVQTAIVTYITVVGFVYNLLLRNVLPSEGLETLIHEILHSIVPPLVILYWAIWVNARSLRLSTIWRWLIYPAVYTLFIFFSGSFVHWYPYPFLDLRELSTAVVIRNCAGILLVFILFSWLYCFWGKRKSFH